MEYAAICRECRRLALLAGAAIMDIYDSDDFEASADMRAKADESPVTAADEAADRLISAGLRAAFPDIPVVTEEETETHSLDTGARFFLVDPLDGTKEFIKRRGEFTVNIALIEGGVPTRGVVYAPAIGRLFITGPEGGAVEETGAMNPDAPGEQRSMTVSTPDNGALAVVASKSHRDAATDAYITRYKVTEFKSAGSSLKFCLVAAGEADLYPRLGRTMEWDTAAGHAVLRAAGGHVDRFDGTGPLVYGKTGFENPFFIAYAPGVDLKLA